MAVVVCTIYDRDDPPYDGSGATPLGTLDHLLHFSAREVESIHGINAVQIEVNRNDADAALIQAGRWMTVTIASIQEDPVMTVRLGPSHTVVLASEGEEVIHVGGLGILSLFEDAKLLDTVHAPDQPCRGSCPTVPERWSWRAGLADPIAYGGIIVRGIEEGQNQTGEPLDPITITFDRDETTSGAAWPDITAEFQQPVGLSIMGLYRRIGEAGDVFLREHPDFTVDGFSAYGQGTFGVDRTSATFAADKVRVYAAPDDPDSNLLTGLEEEGEDEPFTHVLVKGTGDVYAQVAATWYTSGPARWASIEYRDTDDTDMLERVGAEWLRRQFARTVAREVEIKPGDDPANGRYLPWKHLHTGDLHTIDAGGIDEAARLVAFRVELVRGAHDTTTEDAHRSLRVVCEYNDPGSTDGEGFNDSLGGNGEPGNCCGPRPPLQPTDPVVGGSVRLYHTDWRAGSGDSAEALAAPALSASDASGSWDAEAASYGFARMMYDTPQSADDGAVAFDAVNFAVGDYASRAEMILLDNATLLSVIQGGGTVKGQNRATSRHGVGINESLQDDVLETTGRIYRPGSGFVATLWDVGDLTGTLKFAAQSTPVNRTFSGAFAAYASAVATDYLVVEYGFHHAGPTSGGAGAGIRFNDTAGSDLPEDQVTTTNLRSWVEFTGTGSAGTPGDVPEPVGPSGGGSPGDDTGTFTPINHVHAHGLLSTSGTRYHDDAHIEVTGTDGVNLGANVADALDQLASKLDGGTDGQVLTKQSDDDYDVDWEDPAGGAITVEDDEQDVQVSPVTTLQFEKDDFAVSDEGSGVAKVTFIGTAAGAITVEEDGDTPIANVDHIVFDGATVTDDTGGQVTVSGFGGGGGGAGITILQPTSDTYVNSQATTTNSDTEDILILDNSWGTASFTRFILMTFDISALAGKTIGTAVLSLIRTNAGTSNASTIGAVKILRAYVPNQVTWNVYSTGNNWTTAGAQSSGNDRAAVFYGSGILRHGSNSETQLDIARLLQLEIDASVTTMRIMIGAHFDPGDAITFASMENATTANRPRLVVVHD